MPFSAVLTIFYSLSPPVGTSFFSKSSPSQEKEQKLTKEVQRNLISIVINSDHFLKFYLSCFVIYIFCNLFSSTLRVTVKHKIIRSSPEKVLTFEKFFCGKIANTQFVCKKVPLRFIKVLQKDRER